jgi:hypothetical protein
MTHRIYYSEFSSPDGLLYSGDGNEPGYEPYPLHEDQGDGRFKRYRIAPPQTEPLDVLEKELIDINIEQNKLTALYREKLENFRHYRKQNE